MAFRFQKRIAFPGGRVNISKSGASVSFGVRGAHITIGKTPRVTIGAPGTGLSWTQPLPTGSRQSHVRPGVVAFIVRVLAFMLGMAIGLVLLALILGYG